MTLRHIAVGVDGSELSSDALRWALALAEDSQADVRAIGTWRMPLIAAMPSVISGQPTRTFMADQCADHVAASVEAATSPATSAAPDRAVATEVREGDAGQILAAETAAADLVVVGRTGMGRRHGLARTAEVLLGSAARHLVNHATGPAATVPRGRHRVESPQVLIGLDGSDASRAALAWALDNLPATSTFHVRRAVPPYLEGMLALDRGFLDRVVAASRDETEADVRAAVAARDAQPTPRPMPTIRTSVVIENARDALTDPGFDVDIIVVGQGGLAGRVLGSVADHTVRHASCPVIVIPKTRGDR